MWQRWWPPTAAEEHLERLAVEHVLGRMNFEAEIDAVLVVDIEDRLPAARLLGEAFLDEACGALRIRIEIRPSERAGEADVLGQPEPPGNLGRLAHLVGRPMAPLLRIAANRLGALAVEHRVIGGMDRDHLSLKMRRELADRDADVRELTLDLVAVRLAVVGEIEIEETRVRGRDLDGLVAVVLRPARDALQRIVRRRIPRELRQKQARPLDGPHDAFSRSRSEPLLGSSSPATFRPLAA